MLANNTPSFQEIYDQFKNKVYNTVIGYLQNVEDTEEVTQDVFLEIHRSIQNFKGDFNAERVEDRVVSEVLRIAGNPPLDWTQSKQDIVSIGKGDTSLGRRLAAKAFAAVPVVNRLGARLTQALQMFETLGSAA